MHKPILILLLCGLFFMIGAAVAQAPSIQWETCIGSSLNENAYCIRQTSDQGSIVCGSTGTNNFGVTKLDAAGNALWRREIGGAGLDVATAIEQTSDLGYIVAGYTNSSNSGDVGITNGGFDYWIVKLTIAGDLEWQKSYGGSANELLRSIHQTTDGGYIVSGSTRSVDGDVAGGHGSDDMWILKLNASGDLIWQRALGGSGSDLGADAIRQTSDGGYIVAGNAGSSDGDLAATLLEGNIWVIKLTASGSIEWQKTYGALYGALRAYGICLTADDGYAVLGVTWSPTGNATGNHGLTDYWVLKLNYTGAMLWQQSFGGSSLDEAHDILEDTDGGLVVTGWSTSFDGDVTQNHGGPDDFWVVKLSATGSLLWQKTLGGNLGEQAYSVCLTAAGDYLVAGYTKSNLNGDVGANTLAGFNDYWVVKLAYNPVPVTLTAFRASPQAGNIACDWQTQVEYNCKEFVVERSSDTAPFVPIGTVAAAGFSSMPLNYQFTDWGAMERQSDYLFYRLKIIDWDGHVQYSSIVSIRIKQQPLVLLYPNPVTEKLTLDFTALVSGHGMLTLYDAGGRACLKQRTFYTKGRNQIDLPISFLPAGLYTLSMTGGLYFTATFLKTAR
jgi:hypothetical protein